MRRSYISSLLASVFLVTLLGACNQAPPGSSLTLGATPGDALVTVASDLDGRVVYEGPGGVTLTGLAPGPYVVMTGEGDAMDAQFVTLRTQERQQVTFQVMISTQARGGNPGKPDNPGGGGHTTAGNNLSFPVILADDDTTGLTLPGTFGEPTMTVPYDVDNDGSITDADMVDGYYQFAQKVAGNLWQAESVQPGGTVFVNEVDWGDSLESIDGKLGRPLRIEVSLYKVLATTFTGEATLPATMVEFPMTMLANPSSPNEVQGAGAGLTYVDLTVDPAIGSLSDVNTVDGPEATVYSDLSGLTIQPLIGLRENVEEGDLTWNGSEWTDADGTDAIGIEPPLSGISFASELNVGGKVIYGLSEGGWKPREVGDYRLTFFLAPEANAQLEHAAIRLPAEEEEVTITAEPTTGGTAVVVGEENLTYIDIRIVPGGGNRK